ADVERAHRYPGGLAAPARLDQLALVGEHRPEERDRARRVLLLELGGQLVAGDVDRDHGWIFAPCWIHCPSRARSAGVIFVAFPSGMKVESTATPLICDASAWIWSGVSRTTFAGGESNPGCVGCIEWHGAHRAWTISFACANDTVTAP